MNLTELSFSNNNIPHLLHSLSAEQQQNSKAYLFGHYRKIQQLFLYTSTTLLQLTLF